VVVAVKEGRLEEGTRTLMGGFDAVVTGWSPEMEGLEARDGRRADPAGFLVTFKVAVVELVSAKFGLGSENCPGHLLAKRTSR